MVKKEWITHNPEGGRRVVVTKELPGDRWLEILTRADCRVDVCTSRDILTVDDIKTNELLMLNIGSATTVGTVKSARKDDAEVVLKRPVCAESGARIAISRRVGGRFRLIGYGILKE